MLRCLWRARHAREDLQLHSNIPAYSTFEYRGHVLLPAQVRDRAPRGLPGGLLELHGLVHSEYWQSRPIRIHKYISFLLLQCTQTCGTGSQVREVRCYLNQAPVADEHCNPRTKHEYLDLIRSCNMEPCRPYPAVTVSAHSRRSCPESQFNHQSIGEHARRQPMDDRGMG